ncbi:MAG: diacylglycerol kinase [Gammaproteobacteria bacterium]
MKSKTLNTLLTATFSVGTLSLSMALALGGVGAGSSLFSQLAQASEGEYEGRLGVPANADYEAECGSCHLAYPASLLPVDTWRRMMAGLDDHFGDNAELDPALREKLELHLTSYASRRASNTDSLRISDQGWFRHEHDEVPARMVTGNTEVGSFARCEACHQNAARADFDEDGVRIPGYGRWDD